MDIKKKQYKTIESNMPNYQDGKIYKIVCNITDECYIGSTCEPTLARRLASHVADFKRWKAGKRTKTTSYDIIERGNYQILLIESFPCNTKDELTAKEGQIIRQYKLECECINKKIEGRSKQEYYEDNKDTLKEYQKEYKLENKDTLKEYHKEYNEKNKDKTKEYYESNKDKIKQMKAQKITCICGSCFRKGDKATHERTIKHQDYLKSSQ